MIAARFAEDEPSRSAIAVRRSSYAQASVSRPRLVYAQQFADFHDHPESSFYRSEALGLNPVETWEHLVVRMDALIAQVQARFSVEVPFEISFELLCFWHEEIFRESFPEDAGRPRGRREGEWEHVFFGADIGTVRSRRVKQIRGASPWKIRDLTRHACREATRSISTIQSQLLAGHEPDFDEAIYAVARMYAKVLRIHPWVDGNLRTAFVALQGALSALDLATIELKDLARHDDMMGIAFQGDDQPYDGLAELIADILRAAG